MITENSNQNSFPTFESLAKKISIDNYRDDLKDLWYYFIHSFGYGNYYHFNDEKENFSQEFNKRTAMQKLTNFFKKYSLEINGTKLMLGVSRFQGILSEARLWIMFLIMSSCLSQSVELILKIFSSAVDQGCDTVELMEFLLIKFSELSEDVFQEFVQSPSNIAAVPEEFIIIYKERKNFLKNIFTENENNISFTSEIGACDSIFTDEKIAGIDEGKFLKESTESIFDEIQNQSEVIEKNNEIENLSSIKIIDKNYKNLNVFMLLKSTAKENEFFIIPLKSKFTFEEKEIAHNILNSLQREIYDNLIYIPYNPEIITFF